MADMANVDSGKKLNIIGVFNELSPSSYPVVLPEMALVATYEADPMEVGKRRRMRVTLNDQDGKVVLIDQTWEAEVPPPSSPGARSQTQLVLKLQRLRFEAPGDYQFTFFVDDDVKRTLRLRANPAKEE